MIAELTDAELIAAFVAGDERAFDAIYSRHRGRVVATVRTLLWNAADQDEVVNATFARAARSLPRFRGASSLATWLCCIATNLCRNRWDLHRRRRTKDMLSIDAPLDEAGGETFAAVLPDPGSRLVEGVEVAEFEGNVARAMERLAPSRREILHLLFVADLSYEEIAATLGLEMGTVKSRIARARGQLKALVETN